MSTYAGDDLTPVLAPPPPAGVGYRQGVLLTYDPVTHANTVDVGGAVHTNLRILTGAALTAGAAVAILTVGTAAKSWLILGRPTVPAP